MRRRDFLKGTWALGGLAICGGGAAQPSPDPVIDIHQHLNYSGRPDAALLAHQRAMGVTTTILLPAGRPMRSASTHDGSSNALQAQALGNDACHRFAGEHAGAYAFGANEVPDAQGAPAEIARWLRRGAKVIGEQKFGLACDAAEMQAIYALAREHRVPVLMHWQFGRYNHGFERFHRMLEKYHDVAFIGHAQTWWANIDARHSDQAELYPRGPVTPGGLTDRYLTEYPNMYGDLSAGSGLNALTRDEGLTRDFLARHRRKLLYGSDCSDHAGSGPTCQGAQTMAVIRRLAPGREAERQLLFENARALFGL
jgi:predicted TIM-barrel fold metal-dependent hydrolase